MKKIFSLSIFLVVFCISAQFAYSCSCFQIDNEAEIKGTDFIFVGKVVEITEDKSYIPPKIEGVAEYIQKIVDTRKRYFVKFEVKERFKGVEKTEITLVDYMQNSMCADNSFEKGNTYLVYADKNEENDEVNDNGMCSRTQNFNKKSKDYKELLNLRKNKRIEEKKS